VSIAVGVGVVVVGIGSSGIAVRGVGEGTVAIDQGGVSLSLSLGNMNGVAGAGNIAASGSVATEGVMSGSKGDRGGTTSGGLDKGGVSSHNRGSIGQGRRVSVGKTMVSRVEQRVSLSLSLGLTLEQTSITVVVGSSSIGAVTIGVRAVDTGMSVGQGSIGGSVQKRVRFRLSGSGGQKSSLQRGKIMLVTHFLLKNKLNKYCKARIL